MKKRRSKYTSASQLAQMAVCERQVLLRTRMGDRKTAQQAVRAKWGNEVHDRIHREGHTPTHILHERPTDERCSTRTEVYGMDAPETASSHRPLNEVRVGPSTGNWLVMLYSRLSPPITRMFDPTRIARALMKWVLNTAVRRIKS